MAAILLLAQQATLFVITGYQKLTREIPGRFPMTS